MKTYFTLLIIAVLLGCQESSESNISKPEAFKKSIGERIPLETAIRWIGHETGNSKSARESDYRVSVSNLERVINDTDNLLGLSLYHATDNNGQHHILVASIDGSLVRGNSILDTNSDIIMDSKTAAAWIKSYQNQNKDKVWYHFFGIDLFKKIQSNPSFSYFDIQPAINDDGKSQLVLMVWNTKVVNGKTKGESPETYDMGSACPPCPSL